jgi:hypothetical protein
VPVPSRCLLLGLLTSINQSTPASAFVDSDTPGIIRDLDLERHGYKVFPMGPYYQAWPDGRSLKLHADDARRNHDEIARFSRRAWRSTA